VTRAGPTTGAERPTGEVDRLLAATSALTGVLDREEFGRLVVEQTTVAVGADAATLYAYDEGSQTFLLVASTGWPEELQAEFATVPLGAELPASEVARRDEPVFVGSRREMAERYPHLVDVQERSGTEAWALVPLVGTRLLGILRLTYRREQPFPPQERALLTAIGRQCAQALEGVLLHESEAAARQRADHLLRVVEVAQAAHSLDELLAEMLEPLREMTAADRAAAFLRNERDDLELRAALGLTEEEAAAALIPWGAGIAGKTAALGTARLVDDVSAAGPWSSYLQAGGSLIQVPLRTEGGVTAGVLEVSSRRVAAFEESQVAMLELAAERLSVAIERATAQEAVAAARAQAEGLLRIAEVALAATSLEDLLWAMLSPLSEVTRADRAAVFLRDPQRGHLSLRAAVGMNAEETEGVEVPWGKGIAGTIASSGRARVVDDLVSAGPVSAYLRSGGSLIGVPLRAENGDVIGVLEVSSRLVAAFEESQVAVLGLAAERLSVAIERAAAHDRQRDIAVTLQRSMLPRDLPRVPGIELAARYLAGAVGTQVGGDWYDAFALRTGQIGIAVGDVVGKGIDAAAAMGQLRNAFRVFGLQGLKPSSAIGRVNEFTGTTEPVFATLVYATVDPGTMVLRYACAGHPPPLLVGEKGTARYLEDGRGLPLGAELDSRYREGTVELERGDTLILYTDGLVESREETLDARLQRLAAAARPVSADLDRLLDHILKEMAGPEQFLDDVAVLALRITGAAGDAVDDRSRERPRRRP
jgi:serine phosphatase RsbU (regulator of sigma subunit)